MTWIERTAYPRLPRAVSLKELRESFTPSDDEMAALVRGGTDLVVVADLLGHARLDTVRAYTRPTEDDRTKNPQLARHRPLTSENSTACPDSDVSGRYLS